jgi:hypothetical protein
VFDYGFSGGVAIIVLAVLMFASGRGDMQLSGAGKYLRDFAADTITFLAKAGRVDTFLPFMILCGLHIDSPF